VRMGQHGRAMKADVWDKSDGHCWYCGRELHPFRGFIMEHLIPASDGGQLTLDNIFPSCKPCNVIKGSRTLEAFRLRLIAKSRLQYLFWFEDQGYSL